MEHSLSWAFFWALFLVLWVWLMTMYAKKLTNLLGILFGVPPMINGRYISLNGIPFAKTRFTVAWVLKKLSQINMHFFMKLGWLIMNKPNEFWIQFLLSKYCKNGIGNMGTMANS